MDELDDRTQPNQESYRKKTFIF